MFTQWSITQLSAIKNNEIMKFPGKLMELENIIPSVVTQTQKDRHDVYSLQSGH